MNHSDTPPPNTFSKVLSNALPKLQYEPGQDHLARSKARAEAEQAITAAHEAAVLAARANEMKKHRRWFEKMAEYADVKKDAMDEYDSYIAELEAQALQSQGEGEDNA